MVNIWSFLLQTLSVSVVAALILLIKALLTDKLSPRWQYFVWVVLALRIVLPVGTSQNIIFPFPVLVETLKNAVEIKLSSAYSDAFLPIENGLLPVISGTPQSITDWLFLIYILGVASFLIGHAVSYIRLRALLRKGSAPSKELTDKINNAQLKCGVSAYKVVVVKGLPSAFVCGIIKPVLAVPAGEDIDEKVILHEFLHLKNKDNLANVFWSVLRAFHWCNPFLQYVFNRIGNDIEAFCDQRVLERIEGEERREYGKILLSMANSKYARAIGTTSVSNGGKNIKRRIAAIVRFKKYPKGMKLVSVCLIVLLLTPTVYGVDDGYGDDIYNPETKSAFLTSMAYSRINRCETMIAAIDLYAKGVIYQNGVCIATAVPISKNREIFMEMSEDNSDDYSHYQYIKDVEFTSFYENGQLYYLLALSKESETCYTAVLAFALKEQEDKMLAIPVKIVESDGWCVEETGEPYITDNYNYKDSAVENYPDVEVFKGESMAGTLTVKTASYGEIWYRSKDLYDIPEWLDAEKYDFSKEYVSDVDTANENLDVFIKYEISCDYPEVLPENDTELCISFCRRRENGYAWSFYSQYWYAFEPEKFGTIEFEVEASQIEDYITNGYTYYAEIYRDGELIETARLEKVG